MYCTKYIQCRVALVSRFRARETRASLSGTASPLTHLSYTGTVSRPDASRSVLVAFVDEEGRWKASMIRDRGEEMETCTSEVQSPSYSQGCRLQLAGVEPK